MTGFDTNVLLYCCDKARPERQDRALTLVAECRDGVILWQVACEFIAASRKLANQGFTPADAWERLSDLVSVFPLVLPSPKVLNAARRFHVDSRLSFWDAMIVAASIDAGVTVLYSEDLSGRVFPELSIVNPFA